MQYYDEPDPIQNFGGSNKLELNSILTNTFFRMFLGLFASAITALYAYYSGSWIKMIETGMYTGLLIIEVLVVIVFSAFFKKLSPLAVTILFFAYAFLNGFTLSIIFAIFEMTSIGICFIATALLFGALALIGKNSQRDISNIGTILIVALIIGIALTFINLIVGNTILDIALDWFILAIFCGLTVYDMNKIVKMQQVHFVDDEKLYIYGAMELYLDFINMFLRILSLFGKKRN